MRKMLMKLIALLLSAAMLLSGCTAWETASDWMQRLLIRTSMTSFEEMTYTRPDMESLEQMAQDCIEAAATTLNAKKIAEQVWEFYWYYNDFYTNYNLADIHYCQDVTDIYWEQEYNFCLENSSALDAALDQLHYALADSPIRDQLEAEDLFGEGYFDPYEGDSLWDDTFTALMERESQLIGDYYELSGQTVDAGTSAQGYYDACAPKLLQVLVDLVALRQEIAEYAGYEDYVRFAYDFNYYRDYTPQQAQDYCLQIRDTLVPLYRQLNESDFWYTSGKVCSEEAVYSYVRDTAKAMGGTVQDAFRVLDILDLADTAYSENKYDISYEVFLTTYGVPYLFLCPTGWEQDKLLFAHEFGHFCSDYAAGGSMAGIDVAEIFSQGMEYLSLCYGPGGEDLLKRKMADSLCVYVEQAAYAAFEQQLYSLEGEALSPEGICDLYEQIGKEFGFDSRDWDSREIVDIPHIYLYPQYIISYVVSNDAALQLYQREQAQSGAGLQIFTESLATEQGYFLAFLEEAGLDSPFTEGRLETVRDTFSLALS